MSDEKLRVGVIGTSWWADLEHLPGLQARPDVDLVALCGRDTARLEAMAAKYNVRQTFTDWQRMVARAGLDVLVIATPNVLHYPQAMAAIEAGMHVICEKPLAMNVRQAREMATRADSTGVKTLTFFTHRAIAAASHIKRLVGEGYLGQPYQVNAMYLSGSNLDPQKPLAWRMVRAQAGTGMLGDIGYTLLTWCGGGWGIFPAWQRSGRRLSGSALAARPMPTTRACSWRNWRAARKACSRPASWWPGATTTSASSYMAARER